MMLFGNAALCGVVGIYVLGGICIVAVVVLLESVLMLVALISIMSVMIISSEIYSLRRDVLLEIL